MDRLFIPLHFHIQFSFLDYYSHPYLPEISEALFKHGAIHFARDASPDAAMCAFFLANQYNNGDTGRVDYNAAIFWYVRGIVWRDEHFDGTSIEDIATREDLSKSGIRKIIMGSFDTLMTL